MKVGIFGGSFDPVHYGHLLLAEQALEAVNLDVIRFIPAFIPPHKQGVTLSSDAQRVDMLKLAIAGNENFEVDTCELDRGGISYTVDTLTAIRDSNPDHQLFLLIGADSLLEFHTWKNPGKICELATPVVIRRPPVSEIDYCLLAEYVSDGRLAEIKSASFTSLQIELSSTAIQAAIGNQRSIRYQTPRAVEQYIFEKKLYR